jgi:hypothetical protein
VHEVNGSGETVTATTSTATTAATINVRKVSQELARRLEELSIGADRAKRRLALGRASRDGGGKEQEELGQLFGAMAMGMTGALGEVVDRLARLDQILRAFALPTARPLRLPKRRALRRRAYRLRAELDGGRGAQLAR